MVSSLTENSISSLRISSVVPASVTGNKDHQLTATDLALKLHYLKGVYFFHKKAVEGFTIYDFKKPMFPLLELYFTAAGRIRRTETGRPFIKCNDGGVRIAEAVCDKTVDEWLAMKKDSRDDCLVYYEVLGPDIGFSPLVYVQFTWFKCGGVSVGLSWAHVLGDPISASAFINAWGQILAGHVPAKPLPVSNPIKPEAPTPASDPGENLFPMKKLDPVGDHWKSPSNRKMEKMCFHISAKIVDFLAAEAAHFSFFEIISAILWKQISKARQDSGLRTVTICSYNSRGENEIPGNDINISTVEADFSPGKSEVSELAKLIADRKMNGNDSVEGIPKSGGGISDCIVYGANLTFVNMEEAGEDVYGLKIKGEKPVFVNYAIDGIGDEGVVLVLRGPEENSGSGRTVTVILPGNQLGQLKEALGQEWSGLV